MPNSIKVSSVFVPGGFPNETYIPRDEYYLLSKQFLQPKQMWNGFHDIRLEYTYQVHR